MLSQGFKEQIYDIYRYLPPATQVVLISATLPNEILEMTRKFMTDPVRRTLSAGTAGHARDTSTTRPPLAAGAGSDSGQARRADARGHQAVLRRGRAGGVEVRHALRPVRHPHHHAGASPPTPPSPHAPRATFPARPTSSREAALSRCGTASPSPRGPGCAGGHLLQHEEEGRLAHPQDEAGKLHRLLHARGHAAKGARRNHGRVPLGRLARPHRHRRVGPRHRRAAGQPHTHHPLPPSPRRCGRVPLAAPPAPIARPLRCPPCSRADLHLALPARCRS